MAMTVSGMNSGSISTLFSNLNTGSGISSMSFVSDYNSIRSGSYGKLLNAYYGQNGMSVSTPSSSSRTASVDHTSRGYRDAYIKAQENKTNQSSSTQSSAASSTAKDNATISSNAKDMVSSIDKLNQADTFKKNAAGEYNVDDIYNTVKSYVDSYNNVAEASKSSTVSGINSNVSSINNANKTYAKSLSEIGITVGSDNKLSIDEKAFKSADMAKVKETFGRNNYGYSVRTNAYMTDYYAKQAQSTSTTYGSNGNYSLSELMSSYSSFV